MEDPERGLYGVQFHPEVQHTPRGTDMLKNFLSRACHAPRDLDGARRDRRAGRADPRPGRRRRVVCGLSGGVDSAVAALLVHRAVGEQLTCVFVDHGLLREGEAEQVVETFGDHFQVPLVHVEASERFLAPARGRDRSRDEAHAHRRDVHPRLRGGVAQARRRPLPRAGDALLGRHRVGLEDRGQDQVAPQRRRPARGHGLRALRAAALALQGRGAARRRGARPARRDRLAPAVPRPGPGDPHHRRRHRGAARDPAPRRCRDPRGDPPRRSGARDLAVVRGAARDQVGRRDGRCAHLRVPDHPARGHERGCDDGRLGAPALRPAGAHLESRDQRGRRCQPGRARHLVEAARARSNGSNRVRGLRRPHVRLLRHADRLGVRPRRGHALPARRCRRRRTPTRI